MKRSVLTFLFFLVCWSAAFAQQIYKGIPTDLDKSELIIVKYEPNDLIPKEAKSHARIYAESVNLPARVAEANTTLEQKAKNGYPYAYRVISKAELASLPAGKSCYIFEPGQLPTKIMGWNSVPLYLKNPESSVFYETGSIAKSSIYSPEKVMDQFLKPFQKNL